MADRNNHLAGRIPVTPYPALRQVHRLVGAGEASGPFFTGTVRFEWMDGGFFLVQHVDERAGGREIRGVEYTGRRIGPVQDVESPRACPILTVSRR